MDSGTPGTNTGSKKHMSVDLGHGFENGQTRDTCVRSSLTKTKMTVSKKLQVVENNAEWLRCMDYNSSRLGKCIYECENDKQCEDECVDSFKILQKDCPCEVSSWRCILYSKLVFRKIVKQVVHVMISIVSRLLLSRTKQLKL